MGLEAKGFAVKLFLLRIHHDAGDLETLKTFFVSSNHQSPSTVHRWLRVEPNRRESRVRRGDRNDCGADLTHAACSEDERLRPSCGSHNRRSIRRSYVPVHPRCVVEMGAAAGTLANGFDCFRRQLRWDCNLDANVGNFSQHARLGKHFLHLRHHRVHLVCRLDDHCQEEPAGRSFHKRGREKLHREEARQSEARGHPESALERDFQVAGRVGHRRVAFQRKLGILHAAHATADVSQR